MATGCTTLVMLLILSEAGDTDQFYKGKFLSIVKTFEMSWY